MSWQHHKHTIILSLFHHRTHSHAHITLITDMIDFLKLWTTPLIGYSTVHWHIKNVQSIKRRSYFWRLSKKWNPETSLALDVHWFSQQWSTSCSYDSWFVMKLLTLPQFGNQFVTDLCQLFNLFVLKKRKIKNNKLTNMC